LVSLAYCLHLGEIAMTTKQLDKAVGSAAAVASIAAAVVAANTAAPVIAAVVMGAGVAVTGAALYHKLSSELPEPNHAQE
jgi:hypothetical protein